MERVAKHQPYTADHNAMIHNLHEFCPWMLVAVNDIRKQITLLLRQPGLQPECCDSELMTISPVGECRGWHQETVSRRGDRDGQCRLRPVLMLVSGEGNR